ncbi:hypothetical protein [Agathobacter sp.]|uniref:hypothetical protein n=1 Tax=Agathobacter sp. TaxID=2021311 RepID=UPI003FD87D33
MLPKEYTTPMHMYDIEDNKLIELTKSTEERRISQNVPRQKVRLNLDRYIEMKGGIINHGLHKDVKEIEDDALADDITALWNAVKKHEDLWNPFSDFARSHLIPDENLNVNRRAGAIINALPCCWEENERAGNRLS